MDPLSRALEEELIMDGHDDELVHLHQLHLVALGAHHGLNGGTASPRAHLLRSPSLNAVAVASGAAATSAVEAEEEEEDETSQRLTQSEGLLKASILEKVQSEKRLRRLSSVGDKESMNGTSHMCMQVVLVAGMRTLPSCVW